MRKKWRSFRSLPPMSQRCLVAAAILLPLAKWGLKWGGLNRTKAFLAALPMPLPVRQGSLPAPADVARMTASAASLIPMELTCLPRALVTSILLEKIGLPGELRIGIDPSSEEPLSAHAWVEHEGTILETKPEETRRFVSFEAREPGTVRKGSPVLE